MTSAATIVPEVRERCLRAGLDLLQPFNIGEYNRAVEALYRIPDYGRSPALGLLIGNTQSLWPRFLAALRAQPQLLNEEHPLDTFVKEEVLGALRPLAVRWDARWAHEAPPRRVAMQRLAHISGLAYLSPSYLSVHATYGPWIALRAAVVVDVDGSSEVAPAPSNPCSDCEKDCLPKLQRALLASGPELNAAGGVQQHWQLWLAVRDACPVGQSHRYSDGQIRYHYTKDVNALKRLVGSVGP